MTTTAIAVLLLIGAVGVFLFFSTAFLSCFDEAEHAGNAPARGHRNSGNDRKMQPRQSPTFPTLRWTQFSKLLTSNQNQRDAVGWWFGSRSLLRHLRHAFLPFSCSYFDTLANQRHSSGHTNGHHSRKAGCARVLGHSPQMISEARNLTYAFGRVHALYSCVNDFITQESRRDSSNEQHAPSLRRRF